MNSFKNFFFTLLSFFFLIFIPFQISAVNENQKEKNNYMPPKGLEKKKRLNDSDLENKKEGLYFNGLPLVNSDPNTGIGYGVRVYTYFNGKKENPYFPYTPYLHRLYAQFFQTTGGWSYHTIDYDAPYFLGTAIRIRSAFVYEQDTDKNFYGITESSLGKLDYNGKEYDKMADYHAELEKIDTAGNTNARFHKYNIKKPYYSLFGEYDLFGGIMRIQAGFQIKKVTIYDFTGKTVTGVDANDKEIDSINDSTLINILHNSKQIKGYEGGWDNFYKFGIAFDTRDFEPDPKNGIFIDASLETTGDYSMADYSYTRYTFAPRFYYSPISSYQNLTLALRGVYTFLTGPNIPFFTYQNLSFTDGDKDGLGGYRTLRGFVDARFVGKAMTLVNFEIRERMFMLSGGGQSFNFILVPFVDYGRVFDEVDRTNLKNWKLGYGAGLRIAWNQATIIMIDVGFSDESSGLMEGMYINFEHIF